MQLVYSGFLDFVLLFAFAFITLRNREVSWLFLPMCLIQLAMIAGHVLDAATSHQYFKTYYQGLDVLFAVLLLLNFSASVKDGIRLSTLFHGSGGHADGWTRVRGGDV